MEEITTTCSFTVCVWGEGGGRVVQSNSNVGNAFVFFLHQDVLNLRQKIGEGLIKSKICEALVVYIYWVNFFSNVTR